MHYNSRRAGMVAGGTAAYLVLTWIQIFSRLDLGPFAYLLYPAAWALLWPAPFLSIFHLADRSPRVGAWPNAGGFVVLIALYTFIAYLVAKNLGGEISDNVEK